jgi:hypothetical protein
MTGLVNKGNTIAIPAGFNPRDPASVAAALAALPTNGRDVYSIGQSGGAGIIGPALEIERLEISSGPSLVVVETLYALTLPAETFSLATGGVVEGVEFVGVTAPAAVVAVAGLTPGVSTGASVAVPAAEVAVAAAVPEIEARPDVRVPAAVVTIASLVPAIDAGSMQISVPAASITVTLKDPVIAIGAAVNVPAVVVAVAATGAVVDASATVIAVPAAAVAIAGFAPDVVMVQPGFAVPVIEMDLTAEPIGFGIDVEPLGTAATDALLMVVPEVEML